MKSNNHVKCWLCGQWQREDLTIRMQFNGIEETICYQCAAIIEQREETLELEAKMYNGTAPSLEEAFNEDDKD